MSIPQPTIDRLLREGKDHCCGEGSVACVQLVAVADLPTRFGQFQIVAFHSPSDKKEHAALIRGDPTGQEKVPVRIHSECLTGDALGSLRCDCREQLEQSLTFLGHQEVGVLLYLRQEGRGIGFENKIRAYQLQEEGLDTIQANEFLGFRPDERDYAVAAHMLSSLEVRSILLMSNNPDKLADLKFHGVKIEGRIPVVVPPNPYNRRYLETKRVRAHHVMGPGPLHIPEQLDSVGPNGETSPTG
jgi:GTP cyclohydrolase II